MNNKRSNVDDIEIPNWLRESLSKKAPRELMDSEIKRLESDIDNLEKDLNKGHICDKKEVIKMNTVLSQKNQEGIQRMYKWFARGLATALLLFIGTGIAFVWSFATMTANVEVNTKAVEKIDKQHDQRMEAVMKLISNYSSYSNSRYYSEYLAPRSSKKMLSDRKERSVSSENP